MSNPTWFAPTQTVSIDEIPVGTYPAVILGAKEEEYNGNKFLKIQLDVSEGQYKDYFQKKYTANKNTYGDNTVYNGQFTLWYPKGDGSEKDGWTIKAFNGAIGAIEASNDGFHYDFTKPSALKGKKCGIAIRVHHGVSKKGKLFDEQEVGRIIGYEYAKAGSMKPLADRYDKTYPKSDAPAFPVPPATVTKGTVVDDDFLPF